VGRFSSTGHRWGGYNTKNGFVSGSIVRPLNEYLFRGFCFIFRRRIGYRISYIPIGTNAERAFVVFDFWAPICKPSLMESFVVTGQKLALGWGLHFSWFWPRDALGFGTRSSSLTNRLRQIKQKNTKDFIYFTPCNLHATSLLREKKVRFVKNPFRNSAISFGSSTPRLNLCESLDKWPVCV